MPWDSGTFIPDPTPAPGGRTAYESMRLAHPPAPLTPEEIAYWADMEVRMNAASAKGVARIAALGSASGPISSVGINGVQAQIGTRTPDPPPEWPVFSPEAPHNNTGFNNNPEVGVRYFGMSGRPGTELQTISHISNTIPRSDYPVGTTTIYLGMNRTLTQQEADYLNGLTP